MKQGMGIGMKVARVGLPENVLFLYCKIVCDAVNNRMGTG